MIPDNRDTYLCEEPLSPLLPGYPTDDNPVPDSSCIFDIVLQPIAESRVRLRIEINHMGRLLFVIVTADHIEIQISFHVLYLWKRLNEGFRSEKPFLLTVPESEYNGSLRLPGPWQEKALAICKTAETPEALSSAPNRIWSPSSIRSIPDGQRAPTITISFGFSPLSYRIYYSRIALKTPVCLIAATESVDRPTGLFLAFQMVSLERMVTGTARDRYLGTSPKFATIYSPLYGLSRKPGLTASRSSSAKNLCASAVDHLSRPNPSPDFPPKEPYSMPATLRVTYFFHRLCVPMIYCFSLSFKYKYFPDTRRRRERKGQRPTLPYCQR